MKDFKRDFGASCFAFWMSECLLDVGPNSLSLFKIMDQGFSVEFKSGKLTGHSSFHPSLSLSFGPAILKSHRQHEYISSVLLECHTRHIWQKFSTTIFLRTVESGQERFLKEIFNIQ